MDAGGDALIAQHMVPTSIENWTVKDTITWLQSCGLGDVAPIFQKHQVCVLCVRVYVCVCVCVFGRRGPDLPEAPGGSWLCVCVCVYVCVFCV